MNLLPRESDTDYRLQKGTRRLHKNSGEIWRFVKEGNSGTVHIERESDGATRVLWRAYWLNDAWGSPKTRAGAMATSGERR